MTVLSRSLEGRGNRDIDLADLKSDDCIEKDFIEKICQNYQQIKINFDFRIYFKFKFLWHLKTQPK